MVAWGGAGVFDGDLLTSSLHSKSALAIFKNEALDKMLEEAQATNDPERRKAIYGKAQELIYARLCTQGVVLQPMTVAIEMLPGGVRTKHTLSGAEATLEADTVVLAFGGKANDGLFHGLTGKVPELRLIGDACSPRRIHDALLEGTRVARAI